MNLPSLLFHNGIKLSNTRAWTRPNKSINRPSQHLFELIVIDWYRYLSMSKKLSRNLAKLVFALSRINAAGPGQVFVNRNSRRKLQCLSEVVGFQLRFFAWWGQPYYVILICAHWILNAQKPWLPNNTPNKGTLFQGSMSKGRESRKMGSCDLEGFEIHLGSFSSEQVINLKMRLIRYRRSFVIFLLVLLLTTNCVITKSRGLLVTTFSVVNKSKYLPTNFA